MKNSRYFLHYRPAAASSFGRSFRFAHASRWVAAFLLFATLAAAPRNEAHARDLQGRLGLGYNAEFANVNETNGVPAVSLKYGFTRDLAIETVFGIATTTPGNSVAAAKLFKNIFFETSLNFYSMIGGGVISANNQSGAQFIGGFGVEFFIPGIESLGFSMETGGSFDNISGSFAFKTLGVSFLNAGMHFYF